MCPLDPSGRLVQSFTAMAVKMEKWLLKARVSVCSCNDNLSLF